jgi:hypothetical protein
MKQFEDLNYCPVCNERRFTILNAEVFRKFSYKFHKSIIVDDVCVDDSTDNSDIPVNHIHVKCSKCTYEWIETPYLNEGNNDD